MSESYIYLRLHHIHSLIFRSRFHAQSCFYPSSLNLSFSKFEACTSGGNCWRCCWRVAGTGFHTSYSLLAPKKKGSGKYTLTLWSSLRGETGECVSRSFIRVSHGIIFIGFWFIDWNTPAPAQLEGQTLSGSNSNRSPLYNTTVSPFQGESSRTSAHLGLSNFADRKRERNNNISGATSGPPPLLSTARSMNDIASSNATNSSNVASPESDVSSRLLVSSPPAYESIPAHRLPAQEMQGGPDDEEK